MDISRYVQSKTEAIFSSSRYVAKLLLSVVAPGNVQIYPLEFCENIKDNCSVP